MIGPVIFISFAALLLVGTPIAICLGVSSVFGMLIDGVGRPLDTIMTMLPRIFSSATSKFVLLAVPFFILGGNVMEKAGISKRLIDFAQSCVGHLRGGWCNGYRHTAFNHFRSLRLRCRYINRQIVFIRHYARSYDRCCANHRVTLDNAQYAD